MEPVSATLITFNEERNVEAALESVSWASEIVVVDSGSSDATLDVCRRHTDRIFHRDWTGYVDQKNHASEQARHDWIFSLDADERVTPALKSEIAALRRTGFPCSGYRIPRVAFFMGRWIRHGDWYPDYQLRLFNRRRGGWHGGRVHEGVRVNAPPGVLRHEIEHYTYHSLSDFLKRLDTYSGLAATDYLERGKKASPLKLLGNPAATFIKAFMLKRGFLDGTPGLMVSLMGAVSVFFKYARLYELQRKERGRPGSSSRPDSRTRS